MSYLKARAWWLSLAFGIVLMILGVAASSAATDFATRTASDSVTDLILSNTPAYNVGLLFVWGAMVMIGFIAIIVLAHPKRLPFTLEAIGAFALVRAAFVSLTHLRPFPDMITLAQSYFTTSPLFSPFFTGDDLFFSGHTGLPFLLALIFWDHKPLRYIFLVLSIFFGCVVLAGHLHYSIDVFAAYFITYGTFTATKRLLWSHLYGDVVPHAEGA